MTISTGQEPARREPGGAARQTRTAALVLLSLLALFYVANNLMWQASNEVTFGADRMFHLVSSLRYYDLLREGVSLRSLFAALTLSDYYPPLVHLVVVGFYKLFGVSMDVAAMANSLFLILLLLGVYGIGERLAGPWLGLLSAAIVSLFPIVFSMSRYLYVDFALAAMVAANVCLLLRSDGFRRRGPSLLYGLTLGLGMLIKWTFVVFALPPLLVVLASPGLLRGTLPVVSGLARSGRLLALAALLAAAVTALWFVPNRQATAALPLGYALPLLSWLVWTWTLGLGLALRQPVEKDSGRASLHLLLALGLAAVIASAWYLTRIDFVHDFWLNAYGKPTGRSWGFLPYIEFLWREQLSPLFAVVLAAALLGLAWGRWRRTRSLRRFLALGLDGWVLVVWVLVPYVVFSTRVSIVHSRYIMAILPPLGLAIALALGRIGRRSLQVAIVLLLLAAGGGQFAALSFDALAELQPRLPVLAQGLSIQLPATGRTDPGYWRVPEILAYAEAQAGEDPVWLGLLINMQQMNSQHFSYLAQTEYPGVQLKDLATVGSGHGLYPSLFECDLVLLVDPTPSYARRPETEATIRRLLENPDDTFHRAFDLAQTYTLPDGRRLLLYERGLHHGPAAGADLAAYKALMAALAPSAAPGDAVAVPASGLYSLARAGDGSLPLYPLTGQAGDDARLLADLGQQHSRLWLVVDTQSGQDGAALLGGLAGTWYRAADTWHGPLHLLLYAPPSLVPRGQQGLDLLARPAAWQGGLALQQARAVDASLPTGQVLRLDLDWTAAEPPPANYKVFVHLLDAGGRLVAQHDGEPVDGTRPTGTWQPGETVVDRVGLWLPAGLAPGDYGLGLGLYHPDTGERLPVCAPGSTACAPHGDLLPLATLRVAGDTAQILAVP